MRANHKVLFERSYCRNLNQQFERLLGVLGKNPDDDSSSFLDQELAMGAVTSLATGRAVSKVEVLDLARRRILAVKADNRKLKVQLAANRRVVRAAGGVAGGLGTAS